MTNTTFSEIAAWCSRFRFHLELLIKSDIQTGGSIARIFPQGSVSGMWQQDAWVMNSLYEVPLPAIYIAAEWGKKVENLIMTDITISVVSASLGDATENRLVSLIQGFCEKVRIFDSYVSVFKEIERKSKGMDKKHRVCEISYRVRIQPCGKSEGKKDQQ